MSRAREDFGYKPTFTLEKAIKDYQETVETLADQYKSAWSAYDVEPLP